MVAVSTAVRRFNRPASSGFGMSFNTYIGLASSRGPGRVPAAAAQGLGHAAPKERFSLRRPPPASLWRKRQLPPAGEPCHDCAHMRQGGTKQGRGKTRRQRIWLGAAALALTVSTAVSAETPSGEITLQAYAGIFQDNYTAAVIEPFLKQF